MTTTEKSMLPALTKEAGALEKALSNITVDSDESLAQGSDVIKKAKELAKKVKAEKDSFTKPAKDIIAAAKEKYDPILDRLALIETTFKKAAEPFMLAKMKKQNEQIDKVGERVAAGTLKPETAVKKLDQIGTDANKVRTENSGLRITMRRDIEASPISDLQAIDIHYLAQQGYVVWDMVKARKDALAGVEIPGVKIIEKPVTQSV